MNCSKLRSNLDSHRNSVRRGCAIPLILNIPQYNTAVQYRTMLLELTAPVALTPSAVLALMVSARSRSFRHAATIDASSREVAGLRTANPKLDMCRLQYSPAYMQAHRLLAPSCSLSPFRLSSPLQPFSYFAQLQRWNRNNGYGQRRSHSRSVRPTSAVG
ncbi:hypothetical protein BDN71DRAFT_1301630 [Pleurotus eryngii]|uniref:Uncharacterized protein n=1 Tax=Pleurotus eryngii TaxID=5323 RepID=A0A9P6DD96_PLEER|nr:hypothetical protein BDN71DRAFT_1301630 [Pleurotus eryngii]